MQLTVWVALALLGVVAGFKQPFRKALGHRNNMAQVRILTTRLKESVEDKQWSLFNKFHVGNWLGVQTIHDYTDDDRVDRDEIERTRKLTGTSLRRIDEKTVEHSSMVRDDFAFCGVVPIYETLLITKFGSTICSMKSPLLPLNGSSTLNATLTHTLHYYTFLLPVNNKRYIKQMISNKEIERRKLATYSLGANMPSNSKFVENVSIGGPSIDPKSQEMTIQFSFSTGDGHRIKALLLYVNT